MAKVSIVNVEVINAEAPFSAPYRFRITFDANEELPEDLEWKLTYVGCAESNDYDQVLDSVLVGPVPCGRHVFVFDAPAPDATRIPSGELIGVTVVLLTCAYRDQEFARIGYFVRVEYDDPEMRENPPAQPVYERLVRVLLADSPRVTRLTINWNGDATKDVEDLPIDGASTSAAAANEVDEGVSSSTSANAADSNVAQTREQEPSSSESESRSRSDEKQTEAEPADEAATATVTKPENGVSEQNATTLESESEAKTQVSDGASKPEVNQAGDQDDEQEVARKRAKMDEANANGVATSVSVTAAN